MAQKKGNLSITSENIFPVIKKWLYSDHDIFLRELISNGCDAITKLKKLEMMGEYELPGDYKAKITVTVNPEEKTLTVSDNGLGMTADEVDEYINQIAFSGATDFLEKYKDKANEDQIIGHFGLGFYSAFMVADYVYIDTLSYQDGASPVHWECDGGTEFTMDDGTRDTVGTTITLMLNEDCLEFANEYRIREVLEKYCSFMPIEIYLEKANAEEEYETIDAADKRDTDTVIEEIHEEAKYEEKENEDGTKEQVEISPAKEKLKIVKRPVPVNDTNPLWMKSPSECTDEEYKEFYRKVFLDFKEPLFWIHLNMDYPFNLKGILYFPKINTEYDSIEGTIKLYNNQVFIADNIKEVIPEFLMLLKGVIDCPDLPLNVSRSALQNDGFVTKISDYITKKVADKLSGMCKTDKESYEKYWDDISPFIKYGCIRDEKFAEKMDDFVIYQDINDKYLTLDEILEENKEKHENTVFYVTNRRLQGQYIAMFRKSRLNAVYLESIIDTNFIGHVEQKKEGVKFIRVDADLDKAFTKRTSKADQAELDKKAGEIQEKMRKALGNEKLAVSIKNLKNPETSSILTVSEESKRMEDMMIQMGMTDNLEQFKDPGTLVLNAGNSLVQYVLENPDGENTEVVLEQLLDLAKLGNGPLTSEEMSKFIARSNQIMISLANAEKKD